MHDSLVQDAILRVGEVCGIEGRKVFIRLDKEKNTSDLLFQGEILKNVVVGSYIEIKKGFLSIIGKVEGEHLEEDKIKNAQYQRIDINKRTLTITLSGFINYENKFIGGIKELPLIGNEAFILTDKKINAIHDLLGEEDDISICVAKTDIEELPVNLPIDKLFNSHIAIFGNTGSGKSNTLAALYQSIFENLVNHQHFIANSRFFFFDFNGEYINDECLTTKKTVYNLTTKDNSKDKIPISFDELMDVETLSILVEATEKTQKPFLKRALRYYKHVKSSTHTDGTSNYITYFKRILKKHIVTTLKMANKDAAFKILDHIEEILEFFTDDPSKLDLRSDLEFNNKYTCFYKKESNAEKYFATNEDAIETTLIYKQADGLGIDDLLNLSDLDQFFIFILMKLIDDLFKYKVQIDHIMPVINRFKAKQTSIQRVFEISKSDIWKNHNIVVLNLHDVNLDMRKTIPLLMAKHIYNNHKKENNKKSLSIIIDEAHNILSKSSFRETEDWKDYRLETFEEIIKEGRKFGVFITIASQRPNDISETIISQAHNYFIHQLINQRDLNTIGNAVSYIDKVTEESIPSLPVGTCIFSGIATPMPLKIKIDELPDRQKPQSRTLKFKDILSENTANIPPVR